MNMHFKLIALNPLHTVVKSKNCHQEMIDIWFGGSTPAWKAFFRTMFMIVSAIFHIVLWPVVMHGRKFLSEAKYLTW